MSLKNLVSTLSVAFVLGACQQTAGDLANDDGLAPPASGSGIDYTDREIAELERAAASASPEFVDEAGMSTAASDVVQQPEGQTDKTLPSKLDQTTVASTGAKILVTSYSPPPTGTVFTWRNNWATLPPVISYKVAGPVKVKDALYIKFISTEGPREPVSAYYDLKNFNLKAYRSADNKPITSWQPMEQRYRFPLKAGDKWVTTWKSKDHKKDIVTSGSGTVEVIGLETLNLPAGKIQAVKVKMPVQAGAPKGMQHFVWFAPALGVTAKEQITSGPLNWTQILEKVTFPKAS